MLKTIKKAGKIPQNSELNPESLGEEIDSNFFKKTVKQFKGKIKEN